MRFASSDTPLDADGEYNTGPLLADVFDNVTGSVFSDQVGTLYIEQSGDQVNWDISTSYDVSASDGKGFSESLLLPYFRIRFVNGSTDQGEFRIWIRTTSAGDKY